MGAQVSDTNMKLILFGVDILHESAIQKWKIDPVFEDKILDLKKKHSIEHLEIILTTDTRKEQLLRWIKDAKLKRTNVFVLITDKMNYRINDLGQSVAMTSENIEELLQAIVNKSQSAHFNPLALITREIKVKFQVKIIQYELGNQTFRKLHKQLLERECSVQICQSLESFENSLMFSTSDFVIWRKSDKFINSEGLYQCFKYLNQMIFYSELSKDSTTQLLEVLKQQQPNNGAIHKTTHQQLQNLPKFIAERPDKQGFTVKPFTKILIMSRISNKSKQKLEKRKDKIVELRKSYDYKTSGKQTNKGLQMKQFGDNEQLIKQIKTIVSSPDSYATVLFIHYKSSNIRIIREQLKKLGMNRNVLLLTIMKSFPIINNPSQSPQQRILEQQKIRRSHYYRIQKKNAQSIDVVWEKDDIFNPIQKQHLQIHTKINQFKSLQEYQQKISTQASHLSHFIIGNYETICVLRNKYIFNQQPRDEKVYLKIKNMKKLKYICFDSQKNLLIMKKEKILAPDENQNIFCTDNVLEIGEYLNNNPVEQLILHEQTFARQAQIYNSVIEKLFVLKRRGRIQDLQGETEGKYYKLSQQICFFEDLRYDANWIKVFKDFLVQYCLLWKLDYLPTNDFKRLKEDCIKALYKLYKSEVIETSDSVFCKQYLQKVNKCESLSELASTAIYLFSLPHGMSSALNYLLNMFNLNLLMINVFKPLFFVLMLNYNVIFQPKYQMEKKILYVQYKNFSERSTGLKLGFEKGTRFYNMNFLETREVVNESKDYIRIQYDYYPLRELSPYYNTLRTQMFSFYRTDAEYTFCPFSCFEVQETINSPFQQIVKVKYVPNHLFVSHLMESNLSSADPITEVLLPIITEQIISSNQNKDETQNIKLLELKSKQKSVVYYNFITSISNNFFNKAQYYFEIRKKINQKSEQEQDEQSKAITLYEEVWLDIKQGEFQTAKSKLKTVSNAFEENIKRSFRNIMQLIEQIILKRRTALKNTNFHIFNSSPLVVNNYTWECQYQEEFDQFVLSESPTQGQNTHNSEFGFTRVPQNFSFIKEEESQTSSVFGKVLTFTQMNKKKSNRKRKKSQFYLQMLENILAGQLNTIIEQQNNESDSSDEENVANVLNFSLLNIFQKGQIKQSSKMQIMRSQQ